jgi:hypothetical protein
MTNLTERMKKYAEIHDGYMYSNGDAHYASLYNDLQTAMRALKVARGILIEISKSIQECGHCWDADEALKTINELLEEK